jgi:phosphatidylcholine synthase
MAIRSDHPSDTSLARRAAALGVHLLTACGAVLGLLALQSAAASDWADMFTWLALALIVDAIDGPLARALKVRELLPRWSGEVLDLLVDYLNYVLVPAVALSLATILPPSLTLAGAAAILISGAIYFADQNMRTDDGYFRGFPAAWNFVVFYLFLLRPGPWLALGVVVLFVALSFAPVMFVHPFRVKRMRVVNLGLIVIWAVLGVIALIQDLSPSPTTTAGLTAIALYFLLAGLTRARAA